MKYEVIDDHHSDVIINIRSYFSKSENSIWNQRNKIKVISFQEKKMTIKLFKIPHIINKIIYTFFRDSKAKKSYRNSISIIEFVPKPIGYAEFFKYGLLYDSYFISEQCHYDFTIREVLTRETYADKENILKQFAAFTYSLHEKGIEHLDYSPGNILIKKRGEEYMFKIIDVNRMAFRELSLENRLKNFSKLWAANEDLAYIVEQYARIISEDSKKCIKIAQKYSQNHKDRKNLKKWLKGQKIVD